MREYTFIVLMKYSIIFFYLHAHVHIFWVFCHILSFSHGIKREKEWNACLLLISSAEKNSFRRFIYLNYLCLFYFILCWISVWRKIYIISANWMLSFLHFIFWVFFIIIIIIRHDILLYHIILGGNNILYMPTICNLLLWIFYNGLFKGVKRARAHVVKSFVTYPSRLSHTCTCLFSLQIITEKTVYNKLLVLYRPVYKMEPESLENAEIRFMSSWSFIYLSACSGTRVIHIYLWFMQIWFMQLILIYMQCSFHGCIHL